MTVACREGLLPGWPCALAASRQGATKAVGRQPDLPGRGPREEARMSTQERLLVDPLVVRIKLSIRTLSPGGCNFLF